MNDFLFRAKRISQPVKYDDLSKTFELQSLAIVNGFGFTSFQNSWYITVINKYVDTFSPSYMNVYVAKCSLSKCF